MATKVSTPMLQPDTQFGLVPPGAVMSFAMSAAPMGWLPCDGAAINRTTYAPLFSAIGYTHGGSGNSFNVPDLRGEFIRGWDNGRAVDTGRVFGTKQKGTIISFNAPRNEGYVHGVMAGASDAAGAARLAALDEVGADIAVSSDYTGTTTVAAAGSINYSSTWMNDAGWGGGVTRPRNLALFYCIKF